MYASNYLNTKKRLPKVNKRANFLALNSSTGIYIADKEKHKIPIHMHNPNAVKRCSLDYKEFK